MSLVTDLIREAQRAIARSPHIFPELYSTCDYISQEDRICHQRTTALLAHAAWMLPTPPAVELENRFVVGYEPHPTKPGKQKAIPWHPDMLLRDAEKRNLLFVDFESPNSSDARVVHRNLNRWYLNYVSRFEETPPYLIITSLPDCPAPNWLFRYAHSDGWNWEHPGKGSDVQQNPFRYWYSVYREARPIWGRHPITFANFNGSILEEVDFDSLAGT